MDQVHKRFTAEQVKVLLKGYCQGTLDPDLSGAIEEILGISRSRFFALLEQYRPDPDKFSLAYRRETPPRLSASVEREIEKELMLDDFSRKILYADLFEPRYIGGLISKPLKP